MPEETESREKRTGGRRMGTPVEDARAALEAASGKPVIVRPDPSLKLIARIAIARGDAPAHIVSLNPNYGEAADYHIVAQCGYAIRTYLTPPDERFDLISTDTGRREATTLIEAHLRQGNFNLPDPVRRQLIDQLYDGLILQLRSVPVGFRVDAWVRNTFPTLIPQQRTSATRQLDEYQGALAPQIKMIAPERIYRANLGMNAASAAFWAREIGESSVTVPYKVAGLLPLGEQLLAWVDKTPTAPTSDRELIRAWGEVLGINGWYALAPFGG